MKLVISHLNHRVVVGWISSHQSVVSIWYIWLREGNNPTSTSTQGRFFSTLHGIASAWGRERVKSDVLKTEKERDYHLIKISPGAEVAPTLAHYQPLCLAAIGIIIEAIYLLPSLNNLLFSITMISSFFSKCSCQYGLVIVIVDTCYWRMLLYPVGICKLL